MFDVVVQMKRQENQFKHQFVLLNSFVDDSMGGAHYQL